MPLHGTYNLKPYISTPDPRTRKHHMNIAAKLPDNWKEVPLFIDMKAMGPLIGSGVYYQITHQRPGILPDLSVFAVDCYVSDARLIQMRGLGWVFHDRKYTLKGESRSHQKSIAEYNFRGMGKATDIDHEPAPMADSVNRCEPVPFFKDPEPDAKPADGPTTNEGPTDELIERVARAMFERVSRIGSPWSKLGTQWKEGWIGHAKAAVAAMQSDGFDRAPETPRRQKAVEKLLEIGYQYAHDRGWFETPKSAALSALAGNPLVNPLTIGCRAPSVSSLLRKGFLISESCWPDKHFVLKVKFETLEDLQVAHSAIVNEERTYG